MANAKDVDIDTELFKAMLVGTYGTGKSVFASSCPTPGFVFDFDEKIACRFYIISYRFKLGPGGNFPCCIGQDRKDHLTFISLFEPS